LLLLSNVLKKKKGPGNEHAAHLAQRGASKSGKREGGVFLPRKRRGD